MFKRVAKRQRKIEREEELGLDGDTKQMLGLQDTDSDESESSSSANESENDLESGDESDIREEDEDEDEGEAHPMDDEEDISKDGSQMSVDDDGAPPMGVMAAIKVPIYPVPDAPETQDLQACVICPQKLFKNTHMVKVHLESNAHVRRMRRYITAVTELSATPEGLTIDDPRTILPLFSAPMPASAPDVPSKRSLRKAARRLKNAERRKAGKAKAVMEKEKAKEMSTATIVGVNDDKPAEEQKTVVSTEGKKEARPKKEKIRKERGAIPAAVDSMVVGDTKTLGKNKSLETSEKTDNTTIEDTRPTKRKRPNKKARSDPDKKAGPTNVLSSQRVLPPLKRQNFSQYFADDETGNSAATPQEHSEKVLAAGASKQGLKRRASHKMNKRV